MRDLVTIRQIAELRPIPNADAIETAVIDGWQCVVKKGTFKSGDRCVFHELDSFLPCIPVYDFLAPTKKTFNGQEGYRLRTIKLKGQISQGLALPLSDFPDLLAQQRTELGWTDSDQGFFFGKYPEQVAGDEKYPNGVLAKILGVTKWERAPEGEGNPNSGGSKRPSNFPHFIPRTDQERINNLDYRDLLAEELPFRVTVKMDGSSTTVYRYETNPAVPLSDPPVYTGPVVLSGICSRNFELKDDEENRSGNSFVKLAHSTGLVQAVAALGRNIAIQAELCGPGVQQNRAKLPKLDLFIFDVYDIDQRRFMGSAEAEAVYIGLVREGYTGSFAPLVKHCLVSEIGTRDDWYALADSVKTPTGIPAEGIVARRWDGKLSFKVVSAKYLLKHEDA